jgi:hypothetical protein
MDRGSLCKYFDESLSQVRVVTTIILLTQAISIDLLLLLLSQRFHFKIQVRICLVRATELLQLTLVTNASSWNRSDFRYQKSYQHHAARPTVQSMDWDRSIRRIAGAVYSLLRHRHHVFAAASKQSIHCIDSNSATPDCWMGIVHHVESSGRSLSCQTE